MNILLIGSGGREHALAWALSASPLCDRLFIAPGNPGTAQCGHQRRPRRADHAAVVAFCRVNGIGFVVVGPEAPLVAGLVDDLAAAGIKAFGPTRAAAQLEGSKAFTKDFCAALRHPDRRLSPLHGCRRGKGLSRQARRADRRQGGRPRRRQGRRRRRDRRGGGGRDRDDVRRRPRRSRRGSRDRGFPRRRGGELLRTLRRHDGDAARHRPGSQARLRRRQGSEYRRHGRLFARAGADACACRSASCARSSCRRSPASTARGTPYRGVLYAGLMLTAEGPQLIEYNVRFGDPEAQVLMPRLKSPISLAALLAACDGVLEDFSLRWSDEAALTVVMAAEGLSGRRREGLGDPRAARGRGAARRHRLPRRHAPGRRAASSPTAAACSA